MPARYGIHPPSCGGTLRLVLLTLSALSAPVCAEPADWLRVEPATVAFGEIFVDQPVRKEVVLLNHSEQALSLDEPSSSCSACLGVALDARVLAPGQAAILTADFDPGETPGPVALRISLPVQQGDQHETLLIPVTGTVHLAYTLSVPGLFFETSDRQPVDRHSLAIEPNFPMKGRLSPERVTDPFFEVRWASAPSDQPPFHLLIESRPTLPRGLTPHDILVPSTDPSDPPCRLKLAALNRPPLHVFPHEISVSPLESSQFRILFLEQAGTNPVEILDISTSDPRISWESSPHFVPDRDQINVYIRNVADVVGHAGDVVVRTDNPEVEEVRIPVVVQAHHSARLHLPKPVGFVSAKVSCGCGPR